MSPDQAAQRTVLVILMGALGDLVRGLALAPIIKRSEPHTRLVWVVEARWAELAAASPSIDRLIVFHRKDGWRGAWRLLQDLRSERFDIALDLQRHLKSGLCSFFSGAPRRIGFHRRNSKEFNWLFNTEQVAARPPDFPKLAHYLSFAEQLGAAVPEQLDFGLQGLNRLDSAVAEQLRQPFLVLVLASSRPSKNWPYERQLELGRLVVGCSALQLVLLGTDADRPAGDRLQLELGGERVLNLAGRMTLGQIPQLMREAAAAVGPDSGPGHIAAAVGTPYAAIFGPTSPERVAPHGCLDLVVRAPAANMQLVTGAIVWERLQRVLGGEVGRQLERDENSA